MIGYPYHTRMVDPAVDPPLDALGEGAKGHLVTLGVRPRCSATGIRAHGLEGKNRIRGDENRFRTTGKDIRNILIEWPVIYTSDAHQTGLTPTY
jgi:hypothetical protein